MTFKVRPFHVLGKALVLFAALNLLFAVITPPIGRLTIYNSIVPGRVRFPYEQEPQYYLVGYNVPVYEDFDAMFGAHKVSAPKGNDEFRVFILGDSSTWGIDVQADQTVAEIISEMGLRSCDGRRITVYNLGYPLPFLMRDLLLLDKAMEYEPDMVLWLISLATLESKTAETYFLLPHANRFQTLNSTYHLSLPSLAEPIEEPGFFKRTIVGQRRKLKNIIFNQMMGFLWAATRVDNHQGRDSSYPPPNPDVSDDPTYNGRTADEAVISPGRSLLVDIISAGGEIAGPIPVVLVNQPMFVATGQNSNIRYNDLYPKWAYDRYREYITDWAGANDFDLWDFWNALPPGDFADRNFHRNPDGESKFASLLAPEIQSLSCK